MASKSKMGINPQTWAEDNMPGKAAIKLKKRKQKQKSAGVKKVNLNVDILESSFKMLAPHGEILVARFYQELFKRFPGVVPLFKNTTAAQQQKKLLAALQLVVNNLRRPKVLKKALSGLGERHQAYGAVMAHYDAVAETLLDVMSEIAGDAWTEEVATAWQEALNEVARIMLKAYKSGDEKMGANSRMASQAGDYDDSEILKSVVDNAMTAIMMIDRDLVITYANKSTIALLSKHEVELKGLYPSFSVSKLIGTCIDIFHSNPAHQRQMLSNPDNLPFSTDIQVGSLIFRINVIAMYDNSGIYIGNSLEWSDVTGLRAKENEARRLQGTVDGAMTAIMMIDRDFNITYANESTQKLLIENESVLRETFPGFSARENCWRQY